MKKPWTCMIVDDEPMAIRVIRQHLMKLSSYNILKTSSDSLEAVEFLSSNQVDLLFLDIEMPGLTGIQLFKTLKHPPALILVTAHRDYAVEGFEINAVDYLLKPVSFTRLLQSLDRFEQTKTSEQEEMSGDASDFLFVNSDRIKKKINLDEIIYVESLKDYICIYTEREKVITRETTKDFEERLPATSFLRIHRSFIINIGKIDTVSYDEITLGRYSLPVGRSYRDQVLDTLGLN